jgi:hypothetical protein
MDAYLFGIAALVVFTGAAALKVSRYLLSKNEFRTIGTLLGFYDLKEKKLNEAEIVEGTALVRVFDEYKITERLVENSKQGSFSPKDIGKDITLKIVKPPLGSTRGSRIYLDSTSIQRKRQRAENIMFYSMLLVGIIASVLAIKLMTA